ncbi:MAG: acetyl-CoA carboxylase biotin carboxylase subunit [Calditrichia bacterium]
MFKKILIANRGEIAIRIMRTAREMGIGTVAIYSAADDGAYHTTVADEALFLGEGTLQDTYLNIGKIIDLAKASGAEAIHPGYGFLAENPEFASACEEAGIKFIGPSPEAIRLMGNKLEARKIAEQQGLPLLKGSTGGIENVLKEAQHLQFPLLVKAAAGGGGKGMRIVRKAEELEEAVKATSREAKNYFGNGTVYVERYIENPRHIEIQVLGDHHGNIIHLFERECSIQRRYQKIIEESPSPTLNDEIRHKMGEAAVTIAKAIGYTSAGTVEFLVDEHLNFYFLEMNTRIQVEHPVTEMVTGTDLVRHQFLIALGEKLELQQEDITQKGHAIECRIYAENPELNFAPSPGKISYYQEPRGLWIRNDSGLQGPDEVNPQFDPMISKLVVWGENREIARKRMILALKQYIIHGISTNIAFLEKVMEHPDYIENKISTHFCDNQLSAIVENLKKEKEAVPPEIAVLAAALYETKKEGMHKGIHQPEEFDVWKMIGHWRN